MFVEMLYGRTKAFWKVMTRSDKDYVIAELGRNGMSNALEEGGLFLSRAIEEILYKDEMLRKRFRYLAKVKQEDILAADKTQS